ncbi:MAG: PilZ domain-containing protein [Syntrophobacterales bacterium]|nr:PilZ domain-containing protein [Syntrophobacterales bacterium]
MVEREQRRFTRVIFHAKAEISTKVSISISGEVKDLSLKGAFIVSNEKLPVGQKVEISLQLPGSEPSISISVKGKVVRTTPEGMGIDFESMDIDTFYVLKEIVAHNLGSEEKAREEIIRYLQNKIAEKKP